MYCHSCGAQLDGVSRFCPMCGANVEEAIDEAPAAKKQRLPKKVKVLFIVVAVFVVLWLLLPMDDIDMVKGGTLKNYDYGKSLGESLNDWFDGDVTWDSYEEDGTVYVTASGTCPYTGPETYQYDARQVFMFEIIDENHFRFLGAYGSDGYEIFTKNANSLMDAYVNFYSSIGGVDLHEAALRAAFGDEEALNTFKENL